MEESTPKPQFKRRADGSTSVYLSGQYIGRIIRKDGTSSSPRSGAYRTYYLPITSDARRLGLCLTRGDAAHSLIWAIGQG